MGLNVDWTPEDYRVAQEELGSGRHGTVDAARVAISARLGRNVGRSTLGDRFKVSGLLSPAHYLRTPSAGPHRQLSPLVEAIRQESVGPSVAKAQPTADRTFVERAPVKIATSDPDAHSQTVLVCPDTHVPYHDPIAWAVFIAAAKKLRPDVLVIIGDFADAYSISSHTKNPQRRQLLVDELDVVQEKLDELDALRIPRTIWTEGNHENRLRRLVAEKVPELDGMVKTFEEYLRTSDRGIEWVPYRQSVSIGRMLFTHDVGRCGVYAARQSLLDVGGNVCFGHSHRAAVAYQGTTKGEGHVALNVGWLGSYDDLEYMHQVRARRDWQHAFGVVDLDETGCVWGQVIPIVNGGAMVRGQKVAA